MTKPVAVFRSGAIGDSRHTIRLDENIHLVLFPSFGRYITSWAISATWPVVASRSRCYRPGSGIWLVVGWLPCSWGLEAGSGWSLRPPTAIYRLYLEAHFTYNLGGTSRHLSDFIIFRAVRIFGFYIYRPDFISPRVPKTAPQCTNHLFWTSGRFCGHHIYEAG
jgi:hypothetical protein